MTMDRRTFVQSGATVLAVGVANAGVEIAQVHRRWAAAEAAGIPDLRAMDPMVPPAPKPTASASGGARS